MWYRGAYRDAHDLRRMQATLADNYDHTDLRVGDLAWAARQHDQQGLTTAVHLWENTDGDLVAWTYERANGGFNLYRTPSVTADDALLRDMLDTLHAPQYIYALDLTRPEDRATVEALRTRGFAPTDDAEAGVLARSLTDDLPVPTSVYSVTTVTTDAVEGRVAAQHAAFASSILTTQHYHRVRATWPYREDLDIIATDSTGKPVAFCTAWLDEQNKAGLLEPVGTDPAHQRQGLATTVCLTALHALRAAGATKVQVCHGTAAARRLYESIGFRRFGQDLTVRKPTS
jgi:predicted N-acetyltransferase YhbS